MNSDTTQLADGIAVIGMAGKFPGAPNLDVFWRNIRQGVESITPFSPEELEVPATLAQNSNYVRARAIVRDVDLFDAEFFGLLPREAEYTDPQHRLLLETAWEALENAACDPAQFAGTIGVFAGCSLNSYLLHNLSSNPEFLAGFLSSQQMGAHPALLGNDKDFLATRISYKLNLRGPSVVVQSACSTSLVAIGQACQNLLTYQCDVALAGGVSVTFPQKRGYLYEEGAIVSRDGRCRPFDAAADGTVFGDGVGLVVLKRADEAIRDGDPIRAIIRGFAVNNDGSGKVSYMAPSVDGQADAIAAAQALAGIDAETIRYVESHGTGTSLGDPIEVAALTKAFRLRTPARQFCALGGLKGNIGHLEVAAGVAGLIKTVLVLENGEIPPVPNFTRPNPNIDFASSPFYVAEKLQAWPAGNAPRRAAISSFGVGGTNAHLVLEQAPPAAPVSAEKSSATPEPQLLLISARTDTALSTASQRLAEHLREHPDLDLPSVAHTLRVGRRAFHFRRSIVAGTTAEAAGLLAASQKASSAKISNSATRNSATSANTGVAFLFPGQGAQQVGMGRDLYDHHPAFRAQVDLCCDLLAPELGLDLRQVLYPTGPLTGQEQDRLTQTSLAQPALFVVEYALAQLWLARGIQPQVMIGHSLGEYVAAVLAGVFTLKDALHLLAVRGRLMQSLPSGQMLAIAISEEDLRPMLNDSISLAAVNGPQSCVVSGAAEEIAALRQLLGGRNIAVRELKTSHAFHSAMMDPILAEFESEVAKVARSTPRIPIVSSLHGGMIADARWREPSYWSGQLRRTVRFAQAVGTILGQENVVLLEVGPGQTLTALARQHAARPAGQVIVSSCARTAGDGDRAALLAATGELWQAGIEIKWSALASPSRQRRVALPTYPFERKRYWIEPSRATNPSHRNGAAPTPTASAPSNGHDFISAAPTNVEALIEEQLRIMTKQIEALRTPALSGASNGKGQS